MSEQPTALLTLGRLPKALDIARALHGAGWRVLVAEPMRRHLTGASRAVAASFVVPAPAVDHAAYLAALREIVTTEQVALVVPVSEETMHVAHLGDLGAGVRVFTMPAPEVLALHDKENFVRVAAGMGLRVPRTAPLGSAAAMALAAAGRVVVKPVFSCSGQGVRILAQGDALPAATAQRQIVQEFLPGRVLSNCAIAHAGKLLGHAVYGATLLSGSVAVAFRRIEHAGVQDWVERFVAGVQWSGFISFDFIDGADGIAAIECNPRATSGVHFFEPGDLAHAIINPASAGTVRFKPVLEMQQFYAALTATQGSLLRPAGFFREFRANVAAMRRARDVTWEAGDKRPFLTMTQTTWPIIRAAMRQRRPLGEVATLDVGWYPG